MLAIKYSFEENKIYCGDNIVVLKDFPPECVDLIYIDPPFFSNRNYEIVFNDGYELEVFGDRWQGGINHYIEWMRERIRELYRVLKPTGSFYLHCDHHASHYLKVMLDEIFGQNNFQTNITWRRCHPKGNAKGMANNTDTILYYTKTSNFTFTIIYSEYSEKTLSLYKYNDNDGKGIYRLVAINAPGGKGYRYDLGFGEKCPPSGYRWKEETMREKISQNLVIIKKGNVPQQKRYLSESKGVPLDNLWDNIENVVGKERLGYPTQKPEALLERIISASSNEGDLVLDSFCGCGTSLSVARKLGRRFIGIDVSPLGCVQTAKRINYPLSNVVGMKYTEEELKQLDPYIFQEWVCEMLGGVSNTKKTADGGIDGWIKNLPIEVKNHSIGRPYVQKFESAMRSKKAKKGIIAGIGISKNAVEEVARAKRDDNLEIILVNVVDLTSPSYKGLDVEMGSLII